MIKKIDSYILKKFLGTFFFILLIILLVSIVIDVAEKIDDFIERKPPINLLIFSYYVNFMLFYGNLLSPICVFLAVIYFTSRMTNNTELVAMMSGGISYYRIMGTYMAAAFIIAGFSFYLNAFLVPVAVRERINFEYLYLKTQVVMRDVNIHKKVAADKNTGVESYVFLYSFNQKINEGYNFSMEVVKGNEIVEKLTGSKITWQDGTKKWRIQNLRIHYFHPDGRESLKFRDYVDTTFSLTPDDIFIKEMRAESLPLNELNASIEIEKERGSGLAEEMIQEKFKRFAYPFAAIILTLIGFAVSTKKRRGGTALQIGLGLVISFFYVLLVVTGQALVGENVPVWVNIWMPNFIFFFVAILLIRLAPK